MKKKFVTFCLMATVMLTSCNNDGLSYSCDPAIDAWVKSNIAEIKQYTTADFLKVQSIAEQQAVFRALSPAKRAEIWIDKINQVISMGLKEQEVKHLKKVIDFIKNTPNVYAEEKEDIDKDRIELFLYEWLDYAKRELGWDETTLYQITENPNPLTKVVVSGKVEYYSNVDVIYSSNGRSRTVRSIRTCNCNVTSPNIIKGCRAGDCQYKSIGCGNFFILPCNGVHTEDLCKICSPMVGEVVAIKVRTGEYVKRGQAVVIIEAMKTDNEICAEIDGIVSNILVEIGNKVEPYQILVELKQ